MTLVLSSKDQDSLRKTLALLASPLAAASVDEWRTEVLSAVQPLFRSDAGSFVLPHDDEPAVTILNRPPAYLEDYTRHQSLDFSMDLTIQEGRPTACTESISHGDRRLFTHSEIHALVYRNYRIEDGIWALFDLTDVPPVVAPGVVFAPSGLPVSGLLVQYAERPGTARFGEEGLQLMAMLQPVLRAAAQTWKDLSARRRDLVRMLDQVADAASLHDASGKVIHRNPALGRLMDESSCSEMLEQAIGSHARSIGAVAERDGSRPAAGNALEQELSAGCDRYQLRATRVDTIVGKPGAVLVCVKRVTRPRPDMERLRRWLGLTAREAEVAILIAEGQSNRRIGELLGISEHTARRHTEKVFAKLQVDSRSKVAQRLATLEGCPEAG